MLGREGGEVAQENAPEPDYWTFGRTERAGIGTERFEAEAPTFYEHSRGCCPSGVSYKYTVIRPFPLLGEGLLYESHGL